MTAREVEDMDEVSSDGLTYKFTFCLEGNNSCEFDVTGRVKAESLQAYLTRALNTPEPGGVTTMNAPNFTNNIPVRRIVMWKVQPAL